MSLFKGELLLCIVLPLEDTVVWRQLQIDLSVSHLSVIVLYHLDALYEFLHYRLKRDVLGGARRYYLEFRERGLLFNDVFKLHVSQSVFGCLILFHPLAEILLALVVIVLRIEVTKIVLNRLLFTI